MADKFEEIMAALRRLKREMDLRRLRKVEDRTLYIKIHFEIYSISCEFLGQMFSEIGVVESVDRFNEGDQFHSRVRFRNRDSAIEALNWFYGRCIYDGCCQMELFLGSALRSHSSSNLGEGVVEEIAAPNQRVSEDSVELHQSSDEAKDLGPKLDNLDNHRMNFTIEDKLQVCQTEIEASSQEIKEDSKVLQLKFHSPKVIAHNLSSFEVAIVEVASERMGEFCESVEIEAHKSVQIQNESSVMDDLKANVSMEVESSIEELNQEIAPIVPKVESEIKFTDGTQFRTTCEDIHPGNSLSVNVVLVVDDSEVKIEEVPNEPGIQSEFSKVNSYPPNMVVDELAWDEEELVDNSIAMTDFRMIPIGFLVIPTEPLRLVVISEQGSLSERDSQDIQGLIGLAGGKAIWIVDMKKIEMDKCSIVDHFVFDPGGGLGIATLHDRSHLSCKQMATLAELMELDSPQTTEFRALIFSCWSVSLQSSGSILVFDPGGVLALIRIGGTRFLSSTICYCCEKIVDRSSSIRILSSFTLSSARDITLCSSCCSCYYVFAVLNYPWAACFDQTGSAIDVGKTRLQWDPGRNYSRHIGSCWVHVCTVVCHFRTILMHSQNLMRR